MKNPKIFKTNAALGNARYAYLIRITLTKYLCIACDDHYSDDYIDGEIVDLEEFYVTESNYKLEDSPLYGNYLFTHFLNTSDYYENDEI